MLNIKKGCNRYAEQNKTIKIRLSCPIKGSSYIWWYSTRYL